MTYTKGEIISCDCSICEIGRIVGVFLYHFGKQNEYSMIEVNYPERTAGCIKKWIFEKTSSCSIFIT